MINLPLTPNQYETICIALQIADKAQKDTDVMFASESFKIVLEQITDDETPQSNCLVNQK